MRIALDATPAAVQRAGVGRYARELIAALVTLPGADEFVLASAGSAAENDELLRTLAPGQLRIVRRLPFNPRLMTACWQRARLPVRAESLIGDFDLFHGTDFVVPPSRRPRVVTIHDLSFLVAPQYAEPSLVRYLSDAVPRSIDAATIVITVSASVAAELVERFPAVRDKLVAIPNGVRCLADLPPRVVSSRPDVLAVGTVEPRKNLPALIDAMAVVRETYPAARLTIAGRVGWRSDAIMAKIREAEASDHLRFVESPDDAMLETLYAEATVAATVSHYEGFGLPVLEAMARGVPVVASDIVSLRETGGDAATYADPARPESIASSIVALLDDGDARDRQSALGVARAESFSWHETALRTRRAYDLAIGGRR